MHSKMREAITIEACDLVARKLIGDMDFRFPWGLICKSDKIAENIGRFREYRATVPYQFRVSRLQNILS